PQGRRGAAARRRGRFRRALRVLQEEGPRVSETLVLTRRDVQALLGWDECIAAVEGAFRLHAEGRSLSPGVLGVRAPHGGFHVKAARLEPGRTDFAAKTSANFPATPGRAG